MAERLQKIIAQWGIASRRQAEQLILDQRVRLNGAIAHLGQKANPGLDQIEVDGMIVNLSDRPEKVYLLLHKPLGVVSSCDDPWNRKTVLDLLAPRYQPHQGIHPVGRLDADSTGALLLTNDGSLTFYLTHPRHHIPKTYEVWIQGQPTPAILQQWQRGVCLDDQLTLPAQVEVLKRQSIKTLLKITLTEGRNRQIRRVAELLGHPVLHLHRVSIGPIQLHPLTCGQYRPLQAFELQFLQAQPSLSF